MNTTALKKTIIESDLEETESKNMSFLSDVVSGLSNNKKTLPCKYFYNEAGSQLFEKICELDEYYITRTELALLKTYAQDIAELIGENAIVIEPGSGAGEKIQLLLDSLAKPLAYIPIEISGEFLQYSCEVIETKFPQLMVYPVEADFTKPLPHVAQTIKQQVGDNCCLFFPGSTIGNFSPSEAVTLLSQFKELIGEKGSMLIGVDRLKSLGTLIPAYDDAKGVTAEFNKNLIKRINLELDANFKTDQFKHEARFNQEESRIEMHLVSQQEQAVTIGSHRFEFQNQETIHTENSYKYSDEVFVGLIQNSGLKVDVSWQDEQGLFSVYLLKPA